jgi:hypothetical protein
LSSKLAGNYTFSSPITLVRNEPTLVKVEAAIAIFCLSTFNLSLINTHYYKKWFTNAVCSLQNQSRGRLTYYFVRDKVRFPIWNATPNVTHQRELDKSALVNMIEQ